MQIFDVILLLNRFLEQISDLKKMKYSAECIILAKGVLPFERNFTNDDILK